MSDRDKFHLSASIAVEIIALGVQMMLAPSYGWLLLVLGAIYLIYALFRLYRSKKHLSPVEMQQEIKKRENYLPELVLIIEKRLEKANELSKVASKIPLKKYHEKFLKNIVRYRNARTPTEILYALYKGNNQMQIKP